jgi:acyl-CoA reductase-like NAD-dependent aldehyde dehydrogenase
MPISNLDLMCAGKPYAIALAADLPLSIETIRYYAGWADKLQGKHIPMAGMER